uniref:TRASH domain-containing protein n=1 Tax=Timema bartmani TaxID=61472 RepID=A0A7R9EWB9_9NEOP|nr:unnamed protein product [Timema bartmani]
MEIATDTLTMELSPSLSSVTNSLDIPIEPSPSDSGVYNSSQQVSEISDQQVAAVSDDALLMDKYSSAITNESDMPSEELEKELLEEIDRTKTDENEDSSSNILEDDFLEDRAGESLEGDKENDFEETPDNVADEENQEAPDEVLKGETQKTCDDVMEEVNNEDSNDVVEEENQETLENVTEDENQGAPDNGLEKENTQFDGEDKHDSPKCFSPTKSNNLEEFNNIEDLEGIETSSNVDTRENEASPIIDSSENMDDTSNKDALDNIEESSKNEDIKEIEESSNGESTENVKDSSSIDVSGDDKIPHIRGSLENCEEATMEQTEVNVETLCKNNEKDKLEESNSLELTTNDNTNSEENGKEEIHGDTVEPDLQTSDVNDETLNKEDSSTNATLIEDNAGDAQETEDSLLKDKDDGNLPDVEMAPHVEEEESMEVEDVEDDPFGGSGDKSGEGDETLEVGENSEEKKLVDDEEKADFKMDDCEQNEEKEKEVDKENTPETPTVAHVAEEGEESKEGNEMEVDDDGISVADTNKDGAETETDTIVAENSTNVDKNDTEKESTEESATNEKSTEGEVNTELMCAEESGSTDLEANKEVGDAGKEDDEEICIIPDDLPRVMGTGNKDNLTTTAKTNAGVVNEPIKLTLAKKVSGTRSSINHNDGAEPSTSVIKRTPSRPQRQAAKKAESQIKIRMCKFKLHIAGKPRYLCQDDCFNIFKKGGDYLVTRKPQHRSSGAHDSNRADADLGLVRKCAQCALAITPDEKTLSWETMDFCNEECLGKGRDDKFEGIRLTSDATVEVHILAGHIADSFPHNQHQHQLFPAFGKFQTQLGSHCANCKGSVQPTSLGKYCVRFGYDIKQFCCSTCLEEFKKGLKVCSYCQKDISKSDGFLAPVGDKGQFKDFCTQACMEKYDQMSNNLPPPVSTAQCAVCNNEKVVKIEVQLDNKIQKLCSPPCFAAFKFVNKLNADKCDMCKKYFDKKKVENFSVFYDDSPHNFCCKTCMNVYILANRKIVPCNWCKVKKYNFDMIKRVVSSGQILMMCSLNCLTLYKVSINAVSSKRIKCDMCNGVAQAQYHLTMSDATVRNFCSYQCVMQFQGQYSKSPPLTFSGSEPAPVPTVVKVLTSSLSGGPKKVYPRRSVPVNQTESQANSQIVADKKTTGSDSMCVISEVQSLAPNGQPAPPNTPRSATHKVNNIPQSVSVTTNNQQGSMFKQQVIVKPPPPKVMRNKAVNCKPYMHTKGVSCRPHPCTKETQTDDSMGKPVLIPIPVPIYIPAPMHMYSSPFPVPVPFPLPVPVPIFVPTTRNSITGIIKEIKRIQEKIPTDPFEAELLMMAEMVADEKKAENSDSDSDDAGPDAGDTSEVPRASSAAEGDFSPEAVDTSNTFGEDMLQMALKMASELEEPAVDLEAALTPSTITAQSNTSMEQNDESEDDPEPVHVPERASYRGRKRTLRSSSQRGGASKRGRRASSTVDVPLLPPPEPTPPPRIEQEKPDANMCLKVSSSGSCLHTNMCLKVSSSGSCLHVNMCLEVSSSGSCLHANMCLEYTFGVNAWKHWVQTKNAELEKAATNNRKLKLFKPEILQLTADELNYSLCLFVKEVRKPNGQEYAPDTIYYLCLGIQQYLFENGRIDNIFTDSYYEKFTECLDEVARKFTALYNDSHGNSKKKKVYEQQENEENPLRCPVKLYEFYLSKCPESVKTRNDVFYLLPERSCVPDSPVWYSTMALGKEPLIKMLNRVKMVKEINIALLSS